MMKEVRTIIFDRGELQTALSDLRKRRGKPLPPGAVSRFEITADPAPSVEIHIAGDQYGEARFTFPEIEIAAALIGYCMDRNVPLPAKGSKTIQVIGGGVVLVVQK